MRQYSAGAVLTHRFTVALLLNCSAVVSECVMTGKCIIQHSPTANISGYKQEPVKPLVAGSLPVIAFFKASENDWI